MLDLTKLTLFQKLALTLMFDAEDATYQDTRTAVLFSHKFIGDRLDMKPQSYHKKALSDLVSMGFLKAYEISDLTMYRLSDDCFNLMYKRSLEAKLHQISVRYEILGESAK